MINWALIKPTITGIVKDLSGLTTAPKWQDQAEGGTWTNSPAVFLSITTISGQGQEEEFYSAITVGQTTQRVTNVAGQRRFSLAIRIESFEQDIASPNHAANICNQIRIGLKRSTVQQQYAGIFAIENRLPTQWFNYRNEDRQVSCYIMELQMRAADNDVDTSVTAGSWINEANIQSDTVNVAPGDPTGTQINLDVVGDQNNG